MKKLTIALAAVALLSLTSCHTKNCRCYQLVGTRWSGPYTTTTSVGITCNSLNSPTEVCNEMDDPILDPSDIGVDTKKK
jgi:hypothetical protein